MRYFDGIRVGDKIWTIEKGWTEVTNIAEEGDYRIATEDEDYTMDGKYFVEDAHQSAFWSDPGIVAPPRPKRMKKVKVEVRPFKSVNNGQILLEEKTQYHEDSYSSYWCGPVQTIEIEVEDD